ncbi:MAG: hypothetical protein FWD49_07610 [Firmicutes bacterium]|nr:hypothetical protein [Bacillota bacterium]
MAKKKRTIGAKDITAFVMVILLLVTAVGLISYSLTNLKSVSDDLMDGLFGGTTGNNQNKGFGVYFEDTNLGAFKEPLELSPQAKHYFDVSGYKEYYDVFIFANPELKSIDGFSYAVEGNPLYNFSANCSNNYAKSFNVTYEESVFALKFEDMVSILSTANEGKEITELPMRDFSLTPYFILVVRPDGDSAKSVFVELIADINVLPQKITLDSEVIIL